MTLSDAALDLLVNYGWPGNVRELENTIQRALHLCSGRRIKPEHLGLTTASGAVADISPGTLREMEQKMIFSTLSGTGGNMAKTAKVLGISRATLYRKVKEYELGGLAD